MYLTVHIGSEGKNGMDHLMAHFHSEHFSLLTTLSTERQLLYRVTEVAESSVLLFSKSQGEKCLY